MATKHDILALDGLIDSIESGDLYRQVPNLMTLSPSDADFEPLDDAGLVEALRRIAQELREAQS